MPANEGVVKIARNTVVTFKGIAGLHTVNLNKDKKIDAINAGQTQTLTFADSGEFEVTCEYHPAMKAYVWVE